MYAVFDLYSWGVATAANGFHNDFTFYYAAARIGLGDGWGRIYDLGLQQAQLNAMGSGITVAELARYISPPPLAWLAVPFTVLPFAVAYWAWSVLLLAALGATWYLAAPGSGRLRAIFLVAAIAWLPVIYALQLGQPGFLVALGVAASYALLRAGRQFWAGVALGALVFKPQLAFLAPLALLAARRDRAFLGSISALALLGLASAAALGPSGISEYLARLGFASSVPANRELTVAILVGGAARPLQILIAAWTALLVYRARRMGVEWIYVLALAGGMLATPYVHLDDLAMLGLAGWLCLRAGSPRWTWAVVLALVLVIEGEPIWGPAPVVVGELVSLALLSLVVLRSRAALSLPQIDARPLELHPKR